MSLEAEELASNLMALPEEERRGIFFRLAGSLPMDAAQLAESARRADEMRRGVIVPMSESQFNDRVSTLRQSFRK